eukprot:scaffold315664_cov28-Tisochrysis_lutea.AAC.2
MSGIQAWAQAGCAREGRQYCLSEAEINNRRERSLLTRRCNTLLKRPSVPHGVTTKGVNIICRPYYLRRLLPQLSSSSLADRVPRARRRTKRLKVLSPTPF